MKKALLITLVLILVVSASGCAVTDNGSKSDVSEKTVVSTVNSTVSENSDEAVPSKPDYTAFVGNFEDLFSRRAVASVTENLGGESCHILVHWGSSAYEAVQWEMNAVWKNEKLSYSDCKKQVVKTSDDEDTTYEVLYENGSGYFTFDGQSGNLSWVGAADEDCRECVFEKINGGID